MRRDVKAAYLDLWLADESLRLTESNLRVLEQFLSIAESRYAVGQSTQADVFKAQTQLSRMQQERIRLGRERPMLEAELNRAVGRGDAASVTPRAPALREADLHLEALRASARASRPQLLAQQRAVERSAAQAEIARKDSYPDFDVRFSYGQRDNFQGMRREDLISLTVAINLPLWGEKKREPRVAEAESMRGQASSMYQARLNEIDSMLRQQVAAAGQALRSVRLYEGSLIPQARLTSDASLSAYRVGRVDFFTLLDSRMTVFNAEIDRAASRVAYNKALAEIEFLTGAAFPETRDDQADGMGRSHRARLRGSDRRGLLAGRARHGNGGNPAGGRGRGQGPAQDPVLPQSHGPARHLAGAEEGPDGDGLRPCLRRRSRPAAAPAGTVSIAPEKQQLWACARKP